MPDVSEQVAVACMLADIADILSQAPERWLMPFVQLACHEGNEAGIRAGRSLELPARPQGDQPRMITIHSGDLSKVSGPTFGLSLDLLVSGYPWLFSSFTGRLALLPASATLTILEISGTFDGSAASDAREALATFAAARACFARLLENFRAAAEELVRVQNGAI